MSAPLSPKNLPAPVADDILNAFLKYLTNTGIEPYDHQEEAILELFARGLLKVVCGTDTLGVNVPIRTVMENKPRTLVKSRAMTPFMRADREKGGAIRINDQWRVCFRWKTDGPHEVEIVDYH